MQRYILTGTPGAGKTAVLRWLESDGDTVIEEAATDVIALEQARGNPEPWTDASFPDAVCALQRRRQINASRLADTVQFYDRSPVCTHALATYLGHPVPPALERELDRIASGRVYERRVLFVQNQGFTAPTEARRITHDEALRFEKLHLETYRGLGYDCVPIPPGTLSERVDAVRRAVIRP
ncbi:AAA family ATPase [Nocardiopsis sp. NPDC049922]|uniref:AAA family ATPase n=1 Tax=Nocardiopsis sp. NPDC049922 TaxID=3155157 RepID=UPI0033DBC8BE